jgi:hypothetical protein
MNNYRLAKKTRPFLVLDIVVYAALAVLITVLLVVVLRFQKKVGEAGEYSVEVYRDNKIYRKFSLEENGTFDIAGSLTLVIEDRRVWVENAHCPDKICMSRSVSRINDPITCLPNKITIMIRGAVID